MSPLTAKRILKLILRVLRAQWPAACLAIGLFQAPAAAAMVGGSLFGQTAAGPAPIAVQATRDDVYTQSPATGDVSRGDGEEATRDRQEPTRPKRSRSPWFQIQLPPLQLPRAETQEPALVEVPDLLGRDPAEAIGLLAERRLVLQEGRLLDGEAGTSERIVAQDPAAGARVAPGSSVTVDIELPPPLFPIPAIVGMTVQDAIAAVTGGGFSFESKGPAEIDPNRDRIAAQEPPAGSMQPPGTRVIGQVEPAPAVVAETPPLPERKPLVAVPDLAGLNRDQAAGRLGDARLRLAGPSADELDDQAAVVTEQSPAAGTEVPPGTEVAVVLAAPPPLETAAGDPAPQDTLPEAPPETPPVVEAPPELSQAQAPSEQSPEPPAESGRQIPQTQQPQSEPAVVFALTARDLWWAAGGASLALLVLAGWRLLRSRGAAPVKPSIVSYKVVRDPGEQQIAWDVEPGLRCRLHLRSIVDRGRQTFVVEQDFEPRPVRRYG
ncbi:MAG: PASTA domain-containing protein [Kiloniellales bacterium]